VTCWKEKENETETETEREREKSERKKERKKREKEEERMPSLEAPRLTGMLRTFTTDQGHGFDLEEEFIGRAKLIKELKRTSPSLLGSVASEDGGDDSHAPRFDWKSFSAGRDLDSRRAQIMREAFTKFYNQVSKLIGTEAPSGSNDFSSSCYVMMFSLFISLVWIHRGD